MAEGTSVTITNLTVAELFVAIQPDEDSRQKAIELVTNMSGKRPEWAEEQRGEELRADELHRQQNPPTRTVVHETHEQVGRITHRFVLWSDGEFTVDDKLKPWFTQPEKNNAPWIPKKRKSFISLVRQSIRDGDYDDL